MEVTAISTASVYSRSSSELDVEAEGELKGILEPFEGIEGGESPSFSRSLLRFAEKMGEIVDSFLQTAHFDVVTGVSEEDEFDSMLLTAESDVQTGAGKEVGVASLLFTGHSEVQTGINKGGKLENLIQTAYSEVSTGKPRFSFFFRPFCRRGGFDQRVRGAAGRDRGRNERSVPAKYDINR